MPSFLLTWSDLWCLRKVRSLSFERGKQECNRGQCWLRARVSILHKLALRGMCLGTLHRKGTHVLIQKRARGVLFLFAFALYSADFQ